LALEKISSFTNVLGGINRRCMRGLIGKTIENGFDFSAVPSGKGKLEKISVRISSICDRKGAREDIRQDIFDMRPQGSTRRYPSGYLRFTLPPPLRHSEDTFGIFSCSPSLTNGENPPCDIRRKPVHHGSLVMR